MIGIQEGKSGFKENQAQSVVQQDVAQSRDHQDMTEPLKAS